MPARSPFRSASSWKVAVGGLVLLGSALGALLVLTSPGIARPARRIFESLRSALTEERSDDVVLRVDTLEGVQRGLPVFLADESRGNRPLAHVARFGQRPAGPWVRLRFEPGEVSRGAWRLRVYPPSRGLRAAYEMAVTPESARRFGDAVAQRLEILWQEVILPETEKRLPAFLARIDPQRDTEARLLTEEMTASVLQHLDPLLDRLATHVAAAVKHKFDLLDRLGMLWKLMRGDAEGLKGQILPVAKDSARQWWAAHQSEVLRAIGEGLKGQRAQLRTWAGGEFFEAAREELIQPLFESQRQRLEREGEGLLRLAVHEFLEAPEGGFRVRFAALLRTQLLRKQTALLLIEPLDPSR